MDRLSLNAVTEPALTLSVVAWTLPVVLVLGAAYLVMLPIGVALALAETACE